MKNRTKFLNVAQRSIIRIYALFATPFMEKKYRRRLKDNPREFFLRTKHPLNKILYRLLQLMGPDPLLRPQKRMSAIVRSVFVAAGPCAKKYNGFTTYTVVSAVYNVAPYLDDYFQSLTHQSLDFTKHITLVLVDDASTDESAAIIRNWQRKFPDNIHYIALKENCGQGAARNAGMALVKTPWVTFIDPDDFVGPLYFQEVDNFCAEHVRQDASSGNLHMIVCNLLFYRAASGKIQDTHPLRFKFQNKKYTLSAGDPKVLQLSSSSAFFRTEAVRNVGYYSSQVRWMSFEDAHFIQRYLYRYSNNTLSSKRLLVGFSQTAHYYYRKRVARNSSVDIKSNYIEEHILHLKTCHLSLLQNFQEWYGFIPQNILYTILYDLIWKMQFMNTIYIDNAKSEELQFILRSIFNYFDSDSIIQFDGSLNNMSYTYRYSLLSCYKNMPMPYQFVYIQNITNNRIIELVFPIHEDASEEICIDGSCITPISAKIRTIMNLHKPFCKQRRLWVYIPKGSEKLEMSCSGQNVQFIYDNKKYKSNFPLDIIEHLFISAIQIESEDLWLFMDRDGVADDNAEHLYRYIKENHPERSILFALSSQSPDWSRLYNEGFRLVDFGSPACDAAFAKASIFISSQADNYQLKYLTQFQGKKKFIFLQHGVIRDDLSSWLNRLSVFPDLIITSSPAEFRSITEDGSPYIYGKHQVALTGLPRHDALVRHQRKTRDAILIMPTWRRDLFTKSKINSGEKEPIPLSDFLESEYARAWVGLLRGDGLRHLAYTFQVKIFFFPHPNAQSTFANLSLPEHVSLRTFATDRLQDLYCSSKLMITDYTSAAFEMAILYCPTIYYQFDFDNFYNGSHHSRQGYFDFKQDGFGPVCYDEDALLDALEKMLREDCIPEKLYLDRMKQALPFRDGKNCERVLQAINAL